MKFSEKKTGCDGSVNDARLQPQKIAEYVAWRGDIELSLLQRCCSRPSAVFLIGF